MGVRRSRRALVAKYFRYLGPATWLFYFFIFYFLNPVFLLLGRSPMVEVKLPM